VGGGLDDAAAALLQLRQAAGRQLQREQQQEQLQKQGVAAVALERSNLSTEAPDLDATETEEEETEEEEDSGRSRPEGDEHVAKPQKRPRDDATSATPSPSASTGTSTSTFGSHSASGGLARIAGGDSSDDDSGIKRTKRLPFLAQSSPDVLRRFDQEFDEAANLVANRLSKAGALKLRVGSCKEMHWVCSIHPDKKCVFTCQPRIPGFAGP
jgi:hypothetical protein